MVSSMPWPHFTPGKDPVPILQEVGWAPGPVWTGRKSYPHRGSIPDRPAHSQSLYRLSALFMVKSKNFIFGTTPEVLDFQDFGIIRCLMRVILLYLVISPCQKQNSALYKNKPICSTLNQYEGQKTRYSWPAVLVLQIVCAEHLRQSGVPKILVWLHLYELFG